MLQQCHNHILAGHPGISGTISLINYNFIWMGLKKSVKEHVRHCLSCSRNKPSTSKPTGLLLPLKVPEAPWLSISVDFITDLPLSNGFDTIMVVVDRFTKWEEFFPFLKAITAKEASNIFLKEVFSRHGLPQELYQIEAPSLYHNSSQVSPNCLVTNNVFLQPSIPSLMVKLKDSIRSWSTI